MYAPPGSAKARPTKEGMDALLRAAAYLRSPDVKAVSALSQVEGLDLAAQDSANNLRYSAGMGMVGKQHTNTVDRVDKYGAWKDMLGEVTTLHTRSGTQYTHTYKCNLLCPCYNVSHELARDQLSRGYRSRDMFV